MEQTLKKKEKVKNVFHFHVIIGSQPQGRGPVPGGSENIYFD